MDPAADSGQQCQARLRGRPAPALNLSQGERRALERWARGSGAPPQLVERCRIVLACAEGLSNVEVARRLKASPHRVGRWRARFAADRLDALRSGGGRGAPPRLGPEVHAQVAALLASAPPGPAGWSTRLVAQRCGLSQTAASRIMRELGLGPTAGEGSSCSGILDSQRVIALVGLHVNLAQRAFALLERPSHARVALAHGGTQNDTPAGAALRETLAVLEAAVHRATAVTTRRRSSMKLRSFLKAVHRLAPRQHKAHVIATSPEPFGPAVRRWLAKRPQVALHHTVTRAAWAALLCSWCDVLAARRGSDETISHLVRAIEAYVAEDDVELRALSWTAGREA